MNEQELKDEMAKVVAANVLYRGKPVFHWDFAKLADELLTRIKLAGYVKLAEAQSAPALHGIPDDAQERIRYSYLHEGWRKIEL